MFAIARNKASSLSSMQKRRVCSYPSDIIIHYTVTGTSGIRHALKYCVFYLIQYNSFSTCTNLYNKQISLVGIVTIGLSNTALGSGNNQTDVKTLK